MNSEAQDFYKRGLASLDIAKQLSYGRLRDTEEVKTYSVLAIANFLAALVEMLAQGDIHLEVRVRK